MHFRTAPNGKRPVNLAAIKGDNFVSLGVLVYQLIVLRMLAILYHFCSIRQSIVDRSIGDIYRFPGS